MNPPVSSKAVDCVIRSDPEICFTAFWALQMKSLEAEAPSPAPLSIINPSLPRFCGVHMPTSRNRQLYPPYPTRIVEALPTLRSVWFRPMFESDKIALDPVQLIEGVTEIREIGRIVIVENSTDKTSLKLSYRLNQRKN